MSLYRRRIATYKHKGWHFVLESFVTTDRNRNFSIKENFTTYVDGGVEKKGKNAHTGGRLPWNDRRRETT